MITTWLDQFFSGHFLHLFFPFSLYFLQHFFLQQTGISTCMRICEYDTPTIGSWTNPVVMVFDVEDVVGSILKLILLKGCFANMALQHVQVKVTQIEWNGISIFGKVHGVVMMFI